MNESNARRELAMTLIRRGWMHDQVRTLLSCGSVDNDVLTCSTDDATKTAPQLTGLLHAWPQVVGNSAISIEGSLLSDIDSAWSLIPAMSTKDSRLAVGKRGEAYSFQYLRKRSAGDRVLWVAADDATLGYDIETTEEGALKHIEVKASREKNVRFVLTPNEYRRAQEDGGTYAIHFWGGINLHIDPSVEYGHLLSQGYPLVFHDLVSHIDKGILAAEPREWLISMTTEA